MADNVVENKTDLTDAPLRASVEVVLSRYAAVRVVRRASEKKRS